MTTGTHTMQNAITTAIQIFTFAKAIKSAAAIIATAKQRKYSRQNRNLFFIKASFTSADAEDIVPQLSAASASESIRI